MKKNMIKLSVMAALAAMSLNASAVDVDYASEADFDVGVGVATLSTANFGTVSMQPVLHAAWRVSYSEFATYGVRFEYQPEREVGGGSFFSSQAGSGVKLGATNLILSANIPVGEDGFFVAARAGVSSVTINTSQSLPLVQSNGAPSGLRAAAGVGAGYHAGKAIVRLDVTSMGAGTTQAGLNVGFYF